MSVRLTRERSWVRAPLFPFIRLGSGETGTEPFFVDLMGKTGRKAFGGRGASKGLQEEEATDRRRRTGDVLVKIGNLTVTESSSKNGEFGIVLDSD